MKQLQQKCVLTLLLFVFFGSVFPVWAKDAAHNTVIINQVRGTECCSAGGINELQQQLQALSRNNLTATFTVRWDALQDPEFVSLLRQAQRNGHEIGGFLEITPDLAEASGVEYKADPEQWYEASNAYLLGYSPEERQKILSTYMSAFRKAFGQYPKTTTAWMIDAESLQQLAKIYGVTTHQITREQWGVDSYTLYGGPSHFPYLPSENWALVPDFGPNNYMPLIVRQTITDPVWNYGDPTSSRTSQPNDYRLKNRPFSYFEYIFLQAHDQPTESHTFALVGLENSMPEIDQKAFSDQLAFIKKWQDNGPNRSVLTAKEYQEWWRQQEQEQTIVYAGKDETLPIQSWWITTPQYRLRLRQDNNELAITDLRLYNKKWTDPYIDQPSGRVAYWVVPFVLDGSRYWLGNQANSLDTLSPDNLTQRSASILPPTRWVVSKNAVHPQLTREGETLHLTDQGKVLATFTEDQFVLEENPQYLIENQLFQKAVDETIWKSPNGQTLWGFNDDNNTFTPFVNQTDLAHERDARYPLLFPEVKIRSIDPAQSELFRNNQYAMAGRNPVRLVFFPRDQYGFPVLTEQEPEVTTDPVITTSWERPHGANGMIFVDYFSDTPQTVNATFMLGEFSESLPIYFAPNCKIQWRWCLSHPQQIWWYLKNRWGDEDRARQQAKQEEQFQ